MSIQIKLFIQVLILSFVVFINACTTDTEETQVLEAARLYAEQNSDVAVNLEAEVIQEDFARVRVLPKDPASADEAIMYLKKDKKQWQGIIMGTGFSPEDYQNLGIPERIR